MIMNDDMIMSGKDWRIKEAVAGWWQRNGEISIPRLQIITGSYERAGGSDMYTPSCPDMIARVKDSVEKEISEP